MRKLHLLISLLSLAGSGLFGQYTETFPIPDKGILSGPCNGTDGTSCLSSDFAGVNWTIEGDLSGIDSEPFATNESGQLSVSDIDEEACWVSPVLNITAATAAFELDLSWQSFEDYNVSASGSQDYIDVEYRVDGGDWVQLENAVGGGPRTVSYVGQSGVDGSLTDFGASGISGTTLQIRVCIDHNSSAETTTLSNISATGAELPGSGPSCDLVVTEITVSDENCVNAADGSISIATTTTNGPVTYTISGPVNRSNATGLFTSLPPGTYAITVDDDSFVPGTCRETATRTIAVGVDDTPPTATAPAGITLSCPSEVPEPDLTLITDATDDCTVPCVTEPWINEFHYDNDGTDAGEFIEIAGPAGLDLAVYTIHTYDGSDRMEDQVLALSGTIDDEQNGFGALSFEITGLQNQTEGIALVKNGTEVVEFISYEGSFLALDGPAMGLTSTDVGVEEPSDQAAGESLSRTGTGNDSGAFTFVDQAATAGSLNTNQTLVACPENEPTVQFQGQTDNGGAGSEADPLVISHIYRLTDAAGNTADVVHLITVADTTAPTPSCLAELAVELDTAGMAVLTPEALDMGSVDNCSGALSLSLDRDTLSCDDLGLQMISLQVTDAAGLSASCTTMVTVTGDEDFCAMVPAREARRIHVPALPLYPNPANEQVSVDLSTFVGSYGPVELFVHNALGKVVYHSVVSRDLGARYVLPTGDLAAGVYHVQIRTQQTAIAANRLLISH